MFDACLSRKRLVLLDTCHAGEADRDDERLASVGVVPNENVRSVPFQPVLVDGVSSEKRSVTDLLDRHFVDLRIGIGASVLASSSAHQAALELHGAENGLFTGTMLEGLRSGDADLDGDGSIRVSELLKFCRESVKTVSGGLQEPVARHSNLSEDFPVLLLNK